MRPFLVSDLLRKVPTSSAVTVYTHTVTAIKNPELGSEFERRTRILRRLPGFILVPLLLSRNYDGLVFLATEDGSDLGHIFFEHREDAFHVFSVFVQPEQRKQGLATAMMAPFFDYVWSKTPIRRIRMGAGGSEVVKRVREKIGQLTLPCYVIVENEEGWLRLAA